MVGAEGNIGPLEIREIKGADCLLVQERTSASDDRDDLGRTASEVDLHLDIGEWLLRVVPRLQGLDVEPFGPEVVDGVVGEDDAESASRVPEAVFLSCEVAEEEPGILDSVSVDGHVVFLSMG